MYKKAYTFDDVALTPSFSNVESRLDPDLSTYITKEVKINIPIASSPMDTVISFELADVLLKMGGMPIFNRKKTLEEYQTIFEKYKDSVFITTGIGDLDFTKQVLDLGFNKLLLDTANGWTVRMLNALSEIKKYKTDLQIIAGNVCTSLGYRDLVMAGSDGIRVGIGNGAACLTRIKTGVGTPQFTAIQDCAEESARLKVPFICDGGIRDSRDLSLALAAGSHSVFLGKLLAKTNESAAPKKVINDQLFVNYRGQASKEYQLDNYGKMKKGVTAEGESFWTAASGPAEDVIEDLLGGLRSSMSYLGSKSLKEFRAKATFTLVTPTYMTESNTRKD